MSLSEVDAQLAEIDENLIRNELSELERGENFDRRQGLYEAKHPETKHGGASGKSGGGKTKQDAKEGNVLSFAEDTAKKTGVSKSTVQRSTRIAKNISEENRDAIRDTPIADNKTELLALAKRETEKQGTR